MFRCALGVVMAGIGLVLCASWGCTNSVLPVRSETGGDNESASSQPVNVSGRSFSYPLDAAGSLSVTSGQATAKSTTFRLFSGQPVDRPRTATMTLPAENIRVDAVESAARAIPLNGEVQLVFNVAQAGSAEMCAGGTLMAEYDVTFASGVAAVADETYELSRDAIETLRTNDVIVCVEATANFDAELTIDGFDLSFLNGVETAVLTLQNNSIAPIHILGPNETFIPSTQVSAGGSRLLVLESPTMGYAPVMTAGLDFSVLDTATCPAIDGTDYTADVVWNGSALTCGAEQVIPEAPEPIDSSTRFQITLENIDGSATAADPTETYGAVDHAVVGIISAATPDAPDPTNPSSMRVMLDTLNIVSVESLHLGVATSHAADLPNGTIVATLTLDFTSGLPVKIPLSLGENTAEWTYDRPEHASIGGVQHDQVDVLYDFETSVESSEDYTAYVYDLVIDLESPRRLSQISLTMAELDTLGDRPDAVEPTWLAQDILSVTLIGIPDGEDMNDDGIADEIVENSEGEDFGIDTGNNNGGDFEVPEPEPEPMVFGEITGTVVDAQTADPLSGVTISVADTEVSATTNGDGEFTLVDVPVGDPSISATLSGYITNTQPVSVLEDQSTEVSIGLLQFGVGGESVAAVLSWGEDPSDLDLHMSGPDQQGGRFHIYYVSRTPVTYASLDLDDTASFGPETITIVPLTGGDFVAGDYHVWIDNFSGSPQYDVSNARLTLFAAGAQVAQYSVDNAVGDPVFDIWRVIEFSIDESGAITDLNVTQSLEIGGSTSEF